MSMKAQNKIIKCSSYKESMLTILCRKKKKNYVYDL